ncbi:hypothetical protein KKB43_06165 [Patescibacteria group bacterium]|nr:hypothetical protein [Patescibacteria group bacterium]MBU4580565.1 hypothetical protein [Patescibacteria group bacterium]
MSFKIGIKGGIVIVDTGEKIKLPHELRNKGRAAYYEMFSVAARRVGLNLDRVNYSKVVLLLGKYSGKVVAVVESDATVGDLDDLTNEFTPGGCNNRKYEGLEIHMTDKDYEEHLKDLVLILKAILKEDVIFVDKSPTAERLLKEIQSKG